MKYFRIESLIVGFLMVNASIIAITITIKLIQYCINWIFQYGNITNNYNNYINNNLKKINSK